jgi:hypothetical protein
MMVLADCHTMPCQHSTPLYINGHHEMLRLHSTPLATYKGVECRVSHGEVECRQMTISEGVEPPRDTLHSTPLYVAVNFDLKSCIIDHEPSAGKCVVNFSKNISSQRPHFELSTFNDP